ncbi:MAG: UPF0179 family protein [Candidatus Thermoplasmatota archaeon]|jgi:uncharacterized protein (UPF0179 family)|nr:UPF0179 family protein [Candidatus Thermoplasmatota archaeon]MCL5984333.1 UPF0179 family protein [Candidatus Thermoplasmatota archaeon]
MASITLISERQAHNGFAFNYMGATTPCGPCKFRNACLTLEPGHRYAVRAVRALKHKCALQEVDANVVEVEQVPRTLVVDGPGRVEGSTVEVSRYDCGILNCPHWNDCAGPTLDGKGKFDVSKILEEKVCLAGRRVKIVLAK